MRELFRSFDEPEQAVIFYALGSHRTKLELRKASTSNSGGVHVNWFLWRQGWKEVEKFKYINPYSTIHECLVENESRLKEKMVMFLDGFTDDGQP